MREGIEAMSQGGEVSLRGAVADGKRVDAGGTSVFLSWSGQVSHQVASALRVWLPYFIQSLRPFLSSTDIARGARWNDVLAMELDSVEWGIVCVTPFNVEKVWMNFEAGALSKHFDRAHLVPLLFRMNRSDLYGPLAQFQSVLCSEDDLLNLLYSINNSLGNNQLDRAILNDTFKQWWPRLKEAWDKIPAAASGETRTSYDWLHTSEDLAIHGLAGVKCIWIVSASTEPVTGPFKQTIIENLRDGVDYKCFFPCDGPNHDPETVELERLSKDSPGKLKAIFIPRPDFEKFAATDYVIINPEINEITDSIRRRMLLRLPIDPKDTDYWIDVDETSTVHFVERFRSFEKLVCSHQMIQSG
jgi:hypothetical protein